MEKRKEKKKEGAKKKRQCNRRCQTSVIHSRANPQKWGHTVDISIFRVIARSWANFRSSVLVIDVAPAILLPPPSHWTPPRVSTHLDLVFVLLWQTTCKGRWGRNVQDRVIITTVTSTCKRRCFRIRRHIQGIGADICADETRNLGIRNWHRGIEVARRIWNTDSDAFR